MNDRMRKGCCRLLALLLTLVLVIPAYGQETLDALAAAQGCTAETLLQSDKLTAGDSVSDWVAIAVSRAGTEGDTSAYRKALERYVTRMYREQGGLDRLRATEWQRTALTALALGADPTAFGRDKNGRSVNLLADGVYQFTAAKSLGTQGLNGWIFGLIALDSARFAVPEDAVYTRATILQALVAAQEPEGGFGLTVGNSDVDLTAMTLQALAPYQNSTVTYTGAAGESVTIREVVRRALAVLAAVLCVGMAALGGWALVLAALAVLWRYHAVSRKQFGGITGDLAGWFLQKAELWMLAALCACQWGGLL